MTTTYVVDAHALVWFVEGNPRLGARAKTVLEDQASEVDRTDNRVGGSLLVD